jgi:hypothetical protein
MPGRWKHSETALVDLLPLFAEPGESIIHAGVIQLMTTAGYGQQGDRSACGFGRIPESTSMNWRSK